MSSDKFDKWVEKTIGDQDEFFYRYIYDAYLVIQNKNEPGMYYEFIPTNQGYILKNSVTKEAEFTLDNEEDKISLLNHFVSRFCKMSKDIIMGLSWISAILIIVRSEFIHAKNSRSYFNFPHTFLISHDTSAPVSF